MIDEAFAAIDAANAGDPHTIMVRGERRPKEQAHAELAVEWVRRLVDDPSDSLLLAARAHHVRRWDIPRSDEPDGRAGYLKWKRRLQQHHAEVAAQVLGEVGVDPETIERVQAIVKKERLRSDPDVQALEDALCLVFVETQFGDLTDQLGEDHMVAVVVKTLRKMSPAGREAALGLPLDDEALRIVGRALEAV
ncbi:MAG: hypothetical protein JWN29_3421 [Acidimicrobiales bacterium]|nr:hypothetical protein [Acidimicrobiales bacterium]